MKMSEEMAVRLHRMMWSDMQKELGDFPKGEERIEYKERWITKHFPGAMAHHSCFLCEFTQAPYYGSKQCERCPIEWPNDSCTSSVHYQKSPISKILALPARNKKLIGLASGDISNDEATLVRSYYNYREELLSKASGRPASTAIDDHVKAIREKAVEEYFKKKPSGSLACNADEALKQHETKISPMETLKTTCMMLADKVNDYKDKLSEQSGLDRNRPIDDHIREIVKNSMEAGATEERERIMDRVKEVLNP